MATQSSLDTIQKAYITYYGRPADLDGLVYWADRLDTTEGGIDVIIDAFGNSDEFTERYSAFNNEDLINNIYQQAFSRDADNEGMVFYLERLESGEATLSSIALQIMDGSQNEDTLVLQKKIEVSELIVTHTQESGRVYTGNAVAEAVTELLSEVTLDSPSVEQHAAAFDDILEQMSYSQGSYQPEALEEGYQTRQENDLDRDGFVESVKIHTYDDQGKLIRTDEDTDADGNTDSISQWQYDEFGNISRYEVDNNADGQADYISTSVYKGITGIEAIDDYLEYEEFYVLPNLDQPHHDTSYGTPNPDSLEGSVLEYYLASYFLGHEDYSDRINLSSRTIDSDGDGEVDYSLSFEYDEHGRILNYQEDNEGNGQVDFVVSYQYRDPANMTNDVVSPTTSIAYPSISTTEKTHREIDTDGDGQVDHILAYQYNEQGLINREEVDSDGDGQIDSSSNYGYDEQGRVNLVEYDVDGDDLIDYTGHYEWNDSHNRTYQDGDSDGDGIYSTTTFEYNDQGNITRIVDTSESDLQSSSTSLYAYDDQNNLISSEYDMDGDGIADHRTDYEYDEQGRQIGHTFDYTGDGIADGIEITTFSTEGYIIHSESYHSWDGSLWHSSEEEYNNSDNLIRDSSDHDGDGLFEEVINYTYDDAGNLTSVEKDFNNDGRVDYSQIQQYNTEGELVLIGTYGSDDQYS